MYEVLTQLQDELAEVRRQLEIQKQQLARLQAGHEMFCACVLAECIPAIGDPVDFLTSREGDLQDCTFDAVQRLARLAQSVSN